MHFLKGNLAGISSPLFLILLVLVFVLFTENQTRMEIRFQILVFVVGTGFFIVAERTGKPLGEISFGEALGPNLGQVPILAGLLWLIPVLFSFSFTERISPSIYLRSFIAGILTLIPAFFLCANAPFLDFMSWDIADPSLLSYFSWFIGGFLFHFAGLQMQIELKNPLANSLYLSWLCFHVIIFFARIIH